MAKMIAKQPMGFYIGGMGKFYSQMLTRAGFGDEVARVKQLYDEGKRDEANMAVDDKLVEATAAVGPMDVVKAKLDVFRASGVTNPIVSYPAGMEPTLLEKYMRDIVA